MSQTPNQWGQGPQQGPVPQGPVPPQGYQPQGVTPQGYQQQGFQSPGYQQGAPQGSIQGPPPLGYAHPAPQKKRGARWLLSRPIIGVVALIVGLLIGNSGNGTSSTSATGTATVTTTATVTAANAAADKATATVTVTKTNTVTKTAKAAPVQAAASIQDGMSQVGTDVQPGTYKTKVPEDSIACYYARMSGPNDSDIIDNSLASPGNTVYVTIKSTDKYFDSKGCGTWQKTK